MKYSFGISNFPEEISRLSHSIVSLYFFALIAEEGFLISLVFFGTLLSDAYISGIKTLKIVILIFWKFFDFQCQSNLDSCSPSLQNVA